MALIANKYIMVKSTDRQIGDLVKLCTFSGLFSSFHTPTGTRYVATPVTYGGQPAYEITQTGTPGTAFVSSTATPLLLKLAPPSNGAITFTEYNTATSVTAPTPAESINGSQLGI